jgi:tetratricopeptide (TPR) repeat protein
MKKYYLLLISIFIHCNSLFAQLNLPEASTFAEWKQTLGFTEIKMEYVRPNTRGRQIFGGLVPYGELWRTGAHDATTIRFNEDLLIDNQRVKAGKYSLFSIPKPTEWTIILNQDTTLHGTTNYKANLDILRFTLKPEKSARFYETFTIELSDVVKNKAFLYIIWENTQVKIPIEATADERIMAEIQKRVIENRENQAGLLVQAATYYLDNEKDTQLALTWLNQAINQDEKSIYYHHLKAKTQAKLGDCPEAIRTAQKSIDLAKKQKTKNYIEANEKLIAACEKTK